MESIRTGLRRGLTALVVTAAACFPQEREPGDLSSQIEAGGTFQGALESDVTAGFDPQKEYYQVSYAFYRCCLLRTLLSYKGKPADQGGTQLLPDLAKEYPEISEDGLTWTFRLKQGITYGPPLSDVEITARDFVRALEREACSRCSSGGYPFYYSVIEGFDEFAAGGQAGTISGLRTPDDYTLVVRLVAPTGDLGYRFALPATAPIPPNPTAPDARLGVAQGHDRDYGRFLVSSGPYMFEGSENLDFSLAPQEREPAAGYQPGRSIVLVRNPSWNRSNDDLRKAYIDRFEFTIGAAAADIALKVDAEELDMGIVADPPEQISRYLATPRLRDQIHANPSDAVYYLALNVAQPPFDDVYVRRAVNLAIDKDGLRRMWGGPVTGEIAGHIIPDRVTRRLLSGYDPYGTPGSRGDISAAQTEMAKSVYDTDGDGVCDHTACDGVLTVTDVADPFPDQAALIQQNLAPLGLELQVDALARHAMFPRCQDPAAHVAFCLALGWTKDYPDGYSFGPALFGSSSLGPEACCNTMLVGAHPDFLRRFGYEGTTVPSVDSLIDRCSAAIGQERPACWADLDRHLMEEVVPWVPYLFENAIEIHSSRVLNYTFDQWAAMVALDQIALASPRDT
jgi:peptide/nickel transport system substrate-binding protein